MAVPTAQEPNTHSSMDSTFPVEVPKDRNLRLKEPDFNTFLYHILTLPEKFEKSVKVEDAKDDAASDDFAVEFSLGGDTPTSQKSPERHNLASALRAEAEAPTLGATPTLEELAEDNKTLTDNLGIAFKSTKSELVDLFSEMEKAVDGDHLAILLDAAWKDDPLATLKIVWNARSIHLGKGEKDTFMQALGWMKDKHPRTVLANLPWLYRPIIEKKVEKKGEGEEEAVLIEESEGSADDYDVPNGVSHGYWKDLLNILVLSAQDKLQCSENPRDVLAKKNEQHRITDKKDRALKRHMEAQKKKEAKTAKKNASPEDREKRVEESCRFNEEQKAAAKAKRHVEEAKLHDNVIKRLEDSFHHALHLTVARLFARQLNKDVQLLKSGNKGQLRRITYCGKWAPSLEGFHDRHTLIASSIAELLFPDVAEKGDIREMYLKRARETYRREVLSPLRKALEIVERDITAEKFENIKYERLPSLAMNKHKGLFIKKDFDRFEKYIDRVAEGKTRISGAVLMPGPMVKAARTADRSAYPRGGGGKDPAKALLAKKQAEIESKAVDGQWNTLVQRIKDSGTMESAIAVCDVSGSMQGPIFPDGTCPMDTSIGLALLLAEITAAPFGGSFITFDTDPRIMQAGGPDDKRSFIEKVEYIEQSPWGGSTDFLAVFEDLILPLALKHKLKQEDMVKKVFVFSDMQFNAADHGHSYSRGGHRKWETHYERLKRRFGDAGYELPELVFWNLAGGRHGDALPKPVTADMPGTSLVAGYSQALIKVFLDNGSFGAEEEEKEEGVVDTEMAGKEGEEGTVEVKKEKKKTDPLATVRKAIGHKAYDMLQVVD